MTKSPDIVVQIPRHKFLSRRLHRVILEGNKNYIKLRNVGPMHEEKIKTYKSRENLLCCTTWDRKTSMCTCITRCQLLTEELRLWLT